MGSAMRSEAEFRESVDRLTYMGAFPWERYWLNQLRKKRGLLPLRMRDLRRELERPRGAR